MTFNPILLMTSDIVLELCCVIIFDFVLFCFVDAYISLKAEKRTMVEGER
jgi:hypothetical protein